MKKHTSSLGRGLVLTALATFTALTVTAQEPIPDQCKINGFALGVQAWTFNHFTAFQAIQMTAQAGCKLIEFYPGQRMSKDDPGVVVNENMSDADIAKLQAELAKYHVKAINYGVTSIPADEAGARKVFEFAKKLGLRAITTESTGSIDTIEKLVKEYNICVAYHDHEGNWKRTGYKVWNPYYIAGLVTGRDHRIGACADVGHWARSGIDPVEALRLLRGRIISVHLKDESARSLAGHCVACGTGACDIKAILDELKAQHFEGNISIEYEYNMAHDYPEVVTYVDFVKHYGD
jgi:sugar phosphate isomerase/epimerase